MDPAAAEQQDEADDPRGAVLDVSGMRHHYSARDDVPGWPVSVIFILAGLLGRLLIDESQSFFYGLAGSTVIWGIIWFLSRRIPGHATTTFDEHGIHVKGAFGDSIGGTAGRVPWASVRDIRPAHRLSGRSILYLSNGRRVWLAGMGKPDATRLADALRRRSLHLN